MAISDLEKQLEVVQQQTRQAVLEHKWDEYHSASKIESALTVKLSQERMKEYIGSQVFPVNNDDPLTIHLIHYKRNIFIVLRPKAQTRSNAVVKIVVLKFTQCMLSDFRYHSKLNMDGNILPIKGFASSPVEFVKNSSWLEEIKSIFEDKVNTNPELWSSQNHYIVRFREEMGNGLQISNISFEKQSFFSWVETLPETLDCLAQSFEVEMYNENMDEILAGITKQIFAEEERA